jgi:HAMP domain-containing protein/HPt (histidine-containing phosphotransfer) domain-containing protein
MNLQAKLVRTMVATLALIASAVLIAVTSLHIWSARSTHAVVEAKIEESILRKGYGLASNEAQALRELVADNAFGDVRRLVRSTLHDDPDLVYGLFLAADLRPWVYVSPDSVDGAAPDRWRNLNIGSLLLNPLTAQSQRRRLFDQEVFEFAAPVTDESNAVVGTIIYGISGIPLARALERARSASRELLAVTILLIIFLIVAAMAVGVLLVTRAAARISQPLSELTRAATAIASGQRSVRVSIKSHDELETLGHAFNQMVSELDESYLRLESLNRTLEERVADRTAALGIRNRDLRLVLDTVNEGLLTISPDGMLSEERSAKIDQWFGPYAGPTRFVDYLARIDPVFAESFALSHEALIEDYLPMALVLAQMPARLQAGGRQFEFAYLPIAAGTIKQGLLVVVNDVTDRAALMQQEAEQKEVLAALQAITQDRNGFLSLFDDATGLIQRLAYETNDLETTRGLVHTLKGNAGGAGFNLVAELCHQMEDELAAAPATPGARPGSRSFAALRDRWENLNRTVSKLVGQRGRQVIEIAVEDLNRLRDELDQGIPPRMIREQLARWQLEPTERPLSRLGERGRTLAAALGKGDVAVSVDGGGLRLDPKRWARLWSELTHVVRNSVDHGFLPVGQRVAAGRPAPELRLRTSLDEQGKELTVELADNGVGIDWQRVRWAAAKRGLPAVTEADLTAALLVPGFTTRDELSSTSGRGAGMAAVYQLVREWNGRVSVVSRPGTGTIWRLTFWSSMLGPGEGTDTSASGGGNGPRLLAVPTNS